MSGDIYRKKIHINKNFFTKKNIYIEKQNINNVQLNI